MQIKTTTQEENLAYLLKIKAVVDDIEASFDRIIANAEAAHALRAKQEALLVAA